MSLSLNPDPDPGFEGGGAAHDDLVQPFMLEGTGFRGRLLRLGPQLDRILTRHAYPPAVAALLAEMVALAATVSSLLKNDGIFTLQTQGNGPVSLVVADVTHEGALRGYAQYDEERLKGLEVAMTPGGIDMPTLLGEGYLVFTLDKGGKGDRYQGIVELTGQTLADSMQHYFLQSDQVNAGLVLAARPLESGWRAGALLLQQLPESSIGSPEPRASDEEDDWRRSIVLMSSCTPEELVHPAISPHDLLYRLFHEEGVRVFPTLAYHEACRCSLQRIEDTLKSIPRSELEDMKVGNEVVVTCQFCNRDYRFDEPALDALYGASS